VRRSPLDQIHELAGYLEDLDRVAITLCKSTILPATMQNPANLKLVLMQGLAMGFDIIQAIRASFVIETKGESPKVGYYVDSLVALVRASPKCRFFIVEESTASACRVSCARTDEPADLVHRWSLTIEQAREANLDKRWYKDNTGKWASDVKYMWQANPADMLNARTCGRAVKRTFQDVVFGMATPEELDDIAIAERDQSSYKPPAPKQTPITDAEIVGDFPRDMTKQGDATPAGTLTPKPADSETTKVDITAPGSGVIDKIIDSVATSELADDLDREMARCLKILTTAKTREDLNVVGDMITAAKAKKKAGVTDDAHANAVIDVLEPMLQKMWRALAPKSGKR
jgi:hypothetical protein